MAKIAFSSPLPPQERLHVRVISKEAAGLYTTLKVSHLLLVHESHWSLALKDLSQAFERPMKGLLNAFQKPLKGH